ncbi:uracil-DNA glycosylase family protein [Aequorivita viscosa]|uniref:G/U mismatch-specific uracil-DNA glycosylase n=1 Tax=Aequorivita viscosa TaxID=797419 RepID=A0A1M6N895_9FLAO|nr:uracil-DNA glycosylase family protein [Aequorivita viscosa]SDX44334.1 G/U mismatch-specific uracil-DNA glycosylase [Aequorivita viscosa]SHJ91948.1 G/U mismatch-specific uracil-DNA glycosylase [Aequorivita viscosa]
MFHHIHPYPPYIPETATKLIVGTLPPPRFTTGELKEGDVDFCYGSRDGQLWPILDKIFDLNLKFETTAEAIFQREHFLFERGIGVCDMVASARRDKVDASDIGMLEVELRDLVAILQQHPKIDTLLFTGGNSKNGPEYFFRRKLKEYNISLKVVSNKVPRIHIFQMPDNGRIVKTVSLIAPSGAANRAVGSLDAYKRMKAENPKFTTIDFRVAQYKPFFLE